MSIRDVMMLNSKTTTIPLDKRIEEMLLPAGYDGFSRTLFERSSFIVPAQAGAFVNFVLSKFIVPTDGIYKISFDYQFYNAGNLATLGGELRFCGMSVAFTESAYYDTKKRTSTEGSIREDWYFEQSIGIGQSVVGSKYEDRILSFNSSISSMEWKSKTCYFRLRKGDTHVIGGSIVNNYSDTATNFSLKNFKITY